MASRGKNKIRIKGKDEKGERKKEENYIKKGERGLKSASFCAIISTKFRGGVFRPPR